MKKILVIMPLYNQERYVREAIESVIQQTYKNWELVIIDDCSTDISVEIVNEYTYLPNVTLLQNSKNRGCYYSRNKGLEHFKNQEWDLFTIHDPDDVSDITRFEQIIEEFKDNILGIKPLYIECDENLNFKKINNKYYHHGEGQSFYKREVFSKILGYYDDTRFSGDTDYWWRLEAYCYNNPPNKVILSDLPLYLRRIHGKNLSILYDHNTVRPIYWSKIRNEIQFQMIPNNNFYREIFT
jgi:glycosyltransferase involved in cell wall biosynthesis